MSYSDTKVIVIQPPLVQLNSPYPSGAYLKSFFKAQGMDCSWYDLSTALFYRIFSRKGLIKLFEFSENDALLKAGQFENSGDSQSALNIRRYIMQKSLWIEWIDPIVGILTGKVNREYLHKFIFSPFVPRGMRMENYLFSLDREPSVDDAHFLASLAVADLADYINVVFDRNFSLVRYAESLTATEQSFSSYEKCIDSPVLNFFYEELLDSVFSKDFMMQGCDPAGTNVSGASSKILVCISVPFAGTFAPALYTGRWFKKKFGSRVFVCLGGGFVNTELRDVNEPAFYKYTDALSYDRGYGSYLDFFLKTGAVKNSAWKIPDEPLYKMRLFTQDAVTAQKEDDREIAFKEDALTKTVFPDYSDIDFSIYPRMVDDANPMHRIWSDGTWIKAYLAHGCYWHKCSFCDTTLDYVKNYRLTAVEALYKNLSEQCLKSGVPAVHFVDEAMPPVAMKQFALLNINDAHSKEKSVPLSWWGNVRFEKSYTRDLAQILSCGGLCAVSGGIEIATGSGLDSINKGTDIQSIVDACCAFKEAGILVHAYMIYGYYNETDQNIINSMETLRQMFAAGLLDSSFWHKFMLTRHSSLYAEWKKGLVKDLEPVETDNGALFAKNVLHFKGEQKSARFGQGLNAALENWMHGKSLDVKVSRWFDFETPKPSCSPHLIEDCILKYEERCKQSQSVLPSLDKLLWIGGDVWFSKKFMHWYFLGQEESAAVVQNLSAEKIKLLLENPKSALKKEEIDFLRTLRGRGLIMV